MKLNTTGFRVARPEKLSSKDVGGEHLDLHYGGKKIQIKKNYSRFGAQSLECQKITH